MKQMFTVISIVFAAVLANGNGLSVACVFFIIVILDMFSINMHLGKHISNYFLYSRMMNSRLYLTLELCNTEPLFCFIMHLFV